MPIEDRSMVRHLELNRIREKIKAPEPFPLKKYSNIGLDGKGIPMNCGVEHFTINT